MNKKSLRTQLSFVEVTMETDLSTDLCKAVEKNDLNTIRDLISKGVNVNACDKNNELPLQLAIKNEFTEIIEELIKNGANVNVKVQHEKKDMTLLQYAMKESNANVVTLLVVKGATTIFDNNDEETVLHYAAKTGVLELVKSMISTGTNVDIRTSNGLTPLHVAADHKQLEIVKYLCEMGADVNAHNSNESTPLFYAIGKSNISIEIVKFLIENGAEIDIENRYYDTPLQFSLYDKNFEVAKFLIEKGFDINRIHGNTHYARKSLGGTLLHWAARNYDGDDAIKFLIENGADINATEHDGRTPLCLFVKHNGSSEMIKYFVEHGADLNNRGGGSPLYWAHYIRNLSAQILLIELTLDVNAPIDSHDTMRSALHVVDDLFVVKLLIDKGANVNVIDKCGNTPLHYAKRLSIAKCLVENGAEINIKNHEGRTPLHTTLDFLITQYLVEKGADIRATDFKGYTPLHVVNNVFSAEYLIEQGADVKAVTIDGKTVLHTIAELDTVFDARYKDLPNVVSVFLEKGINIEVTDKNGNTPLHLCMLNYASNYDIFFALLDKGANISVTNNEGLKPEDGDGMCTYKLKRIKQLFTDLREGVNLNNIETYFTYGTSLYNVILDSHKTNILHLLVQKYSACVISTIFKKLKFMKSISTYIFKYNFVNAQNIDQWMPLHYAAQRGNSDIVLCLLQNGSMYNAETVNCETPLTLTTDDLTVSTLKLTEQMFKEIRLGNYAEVVNCINKQKQIINAKDKEGNSPLHLAVYYNYIDIIELLLYHEAEIIQINEKGYTPLHLASSKDSQNITEILLKLENVVHSNKIKMNSLLNLLHFFVNIQAKDGMTALHIAAKHNRIEIVKLLLRSGASYNINNKEGKYPVDLSTDTDIITLFEFIQELFNDATNGKIEIINKLQNLDKDEFDMVTTVCTKQRYTLEDLLKSNEYNSILTEFSKIQTIKKTPTVPIQKTMTKLNIEDSDSDDLGFGLFD